jgi:hypothetical protein
MGQMSTLFFFSFLSLISLYCCSSDASLLPEIGKVAPMGVSPWQLQQWKMQCKDAVSTENNKSKHGTSNGICNVAIGFITTCNDCTVLLVLYGTIYHI